MPWKRSAGDGKATAFAKAGGETFAVDASAMGKEFCASEGSFHRPVAPWVASLACHFV